MNHQQNRRQFLKSTSLVSAGFFGLAQFAGFANGVIPQPELLPGTGYGPLYPTPEGILNLPQGFSCKVISRTGDLMNDGFYEPGAHDGMGAFKWKDNQVLLIRNHELSAGSNSKSPFGKNNELKSKVRSSEIYDIGNEKISCGGGTTTLIYNEKEQKVKLEYLSLVGTIRNCAGGITPWNSWITCEETSSKKGEHEGALEKDHGYNFEVHATDKIGLTKPLPLKAMGRFVHEAVAVHPENGIVYQTEDSGNSVFYRFIPNEKGQLHKGGKLQSLVIKEWKKADTRNWASNKERFPKKKLFDVEWIDLDNVEAPENDLRIRAYELGAARFANTEGIWYGEEELFFACTSGGEITKGQIFRYIPSKYEGTPEEKNHPGKIELFLEPNNLDIFENCDNLTIAPWGDVVICEDKADPRIMGITPDGKIYPIAKNIAFRQSEFAGPVFSPSADTLFINIQSPGLTLAITGPWKKA